MLNRRILLFQNLINKVTGYICIFIGKRARIDS